MTESNTPVEDRSGLADRVNGILHSKALPDLHALAWIEPFFNKQDGNWDSGWSCRDHSVVLAALLTAEGIEAQVVHGLTMFVQGPTKDREPPVGNGNDPAASGSHSWVHVPGFGTVDVSPRLSERVDQWRPLPVECGLIGADWSVPRTTTHVALVGNANDYEQAVAVATHATDTATAIYWPKESAEFTPAMLEADYIDSPLSYKLRDAAGADCYAKLAAHLYALSGGARRALAGVSQRKARRYLTEIVGDLVHEFHRALNAGLAG